MKRFMIVVCAVLGMAACGNDGLKNSDDGGSNDMSANAADMAMPAGPDLAMPPTPDMAYALRQDGGAYQCGSAGACTGSSTCCAVPTDMGTVNQSCEANGTCQGVSLECEVPDDCKGFPCCIKGTSASQSTTCTDAVTACQPKKPSFSGIQTRGCKIDADCTVGVTGTPNEPLCCTITAKSFGFDHKHACLDQGTADQINGSKIGTVTCP